MRLPSVVFLTMLMLIVPMNGRCQDFDSLKPIDWGVTAVELPSSWGPTTVAGAGVGYGVSGPDTRELFTVQYVGAKLMSLDKAAIYGCYQHGVVEGTRIGGDGARLILASQWNDVPQFTWLAGIGFLSRVQELADSTLDFGLTFDGGLSYTANDYLEVTIYTFACDRGRQFGWSVMAGLTLKDWQKLVPGL